jgi:hypothetical protein
MKADYNVIPRRTLEKLEKWIAAGVQLDDDDAGNSFIMAILMNDLSAAIARADEGNLRALPQIMRWLETHAPPPAWGSPAALGSWPRLARAAAGSKV